eukprot:CAMPEP_0203745936 /NCGR_PEP_ID=MMETSP0098-20131031/1527_1 /ASSEMBLY_ACC=CAM_ASM_000208 /TAXON_ID=96639 /ORGANISM=" , Strain NY0313808BC1" /LENGTH=72 /DNA_ID=CAMNT_0050633861 /DNA_START=1185 /DNA_END=1403 /DNA_ORIENTATION=-
MGDRALTEFNARYELTVHTFSYIAPTPAFALSSCMDEFTVVVEILKVVTTDRAEGYSVHACGSQQGNCGSCH